MNAIIASVEATKPLEPEVYVLHATGALAAEFNRMKIPDLAQMYIMNQFQNNAPESILEILSDTDIPSRMLSIETIECPFEQTKQLS